MTRRVALTLALLALVPGHAPGEEDPMSEKVAARVEALDRALRNGPQGDSEAEYEDRLRLLTNSVTTSGPGSSTRVYRALRDPRLLLTTRRALIDHLASALPYNNAAIGSELLSIVEDPREPADLRDAAALRLGAFPAARDRALAAAAKLLHDTKGGRGAAALALLKPRRMSPELAADIRMGLTHPDEASRLDALQLASVLGPAARRIEPDVRRALIDQRLMVRQFAEKALAAINARPEPPENHR